MPFFFFLDGFELFVAEPLEEARLADADRDRDEVELLESDDGRCSVVVEEPVVLGRMSRLSGMLKLLAGSVEESEGKASSGGS
jgi:hypothetical protein